MDRILGATGDSTRSLPNLLEGFNIEDGDRSLGGSLWTPDSSFEPQAFGPSTTVPNASRGVVSPPSRSVSQSHLRTPRRATSAGLEASSLDADSLPNTSQFDPPSMRSIFASGQPTSSLSVNTAQASMSTASPGSSSRPFAALTNASASRRRDIRPAEIANVSGIMPQNTDYAILGTEKDVDDPTIAQYGSSSDGLGAATSQALSSLFGASGMTPGQLSREPTDRRSASYVTKHLNDTSTLTGHLLQLGFEEGRHSDITINAFGKSYKLHKLLLDRVPYFSTAFCGPWAESSASEMNLIPEDIDPNITKTAWELAIRRIYGTIVPFREEQEAIGLFATGCWLDMPDLVESCIEHILRQMHPSSLHILIKLVTNSYYGKAGDRILSSAKAILCREGWEMPYEYWDNIPADIIREIIGGDPFYIPSEWERWYLTLRLLNRRLRKLAIESDLVTLDGKYVSVPSSRLRAAAIRPVSISVMRRPRLNAAEDDMWISLYMHADVAPLLNLLDEGIYYVHLRFEQLQLIRSQKDILGIPLLPEKIISDALWMSMELRQRIVNAHEGDLELGISEIADSEDEDEQVITPTARPRNEKGKEREHSADSVSIESETSSEGVVLGSSRKFWIPNNDVSCVMGGSRESYAAATFATSTDTSTALQRSAATPEITDSGWAVDLGSSLFDTTLSASRNFITQSSPRYSWYPPFRFCAEFPNPRSLKERKRVYSQTVWYAGSMWNLYIQRLNTSKNQQLGIYLHRAKDKEPTDDPLALTVDDRIGQLEREMLMRRGERKSRHWRTDTFTSLAELEQEEAQGSPNDTEVPTNNSTKNVNSSSRPHKTSQSSAQPQSSIPALTVPQIQTRPPLRSSTSEMLPLSDSFLEPSLRLQPAISTIPPYTDTRATIKTYFKIYSPSKGGRLLSVFESAPDSFDFGKSWGWRSSWMVLDDGLDGKDGIKSVASSGAGDGKLRYMVVIGNV